MKLIVIKFFADNYFWLLGLIMIFIIPNKQLVMLKDCRKNFDSKHFYRKLIIF